MKNYNAQKNRSIGMPPEKVDNLNKYSVWTHLFGKTIGNIPSPKYKVGDKVRVLNYQPHGKQEIQFHKPDLGVNPKTGKKKRQVALKSTGDAKFFDEIFTISEVKLGYPILYKLFDNTHDIDILGKFYRENFQ